MFDLAAVARSGEAGVTAEVPRDAAPKIADICTPDEGCRYPR